MLRLIFSFLFMYAAVFVVEIRVATFLTIIIKPKLKKAVESVNWT